MAAAREILVPLAPTGRGVRGEGAEQNHAAPRSFSVPLAPTGRGVRGEGEAVARLPVTQWRLTEPPAHTGRDGTLVHFPLSRRNRRSNP
jgi:hypothetical protein